MLQSRIYLIGFMGSGKSFTGRRLAKRIGYQFLDLDNHIVAREGGDIPALFAQYGEQAFRQKEAEALHSTGCLERTVIACGGGTPVFFDNMEWINQAGLSIFLDTDPAIIVARLKADTADRPLLDGLGPSSLQQFVAQKLAQRRPSYEKAAVVYSPQRADEDSAAVIHEQLAQISGH